MIELVNKVLVFLATINKSLAVFLTIVVVIITCVVIYFLYRIVRKEIKRYNEEVANYIDGIETKREIAADVNAYISRSVSAEFTLLSVDMDHFSNVVENFGSEEAERIIKGIAAKLLETIPTRILIGRIKLDSFVVFAKGDYSREECVRMAKKILQVVSEPIKIYDESTLQLTCSVGICYYPSHGRNFKELSESLQIATFICKRSGGNQYRIYSREEKQDEGANMEYYYQIKNGISNKEFAIYYQPIIDKDSKDIYAFEGLLRWNHPDLGVLSPHKFINIMEQTGDINWVGLWGLETVVKQEFELRKRFGKEFLMSINLSPKQLSSPTLPQDFQKIIKKYRANPKNFICEIEEYTIFERLEQVKTNLNQLREIGFQIAVDGFGLDYKGLKKLEDNSVDVIKLDREFLDEEADQYLKDKFVGILVDFVNKQGRTLVCEGVENYDYLERAINMGIDKFQGYHFTKPLSYEELFDYIDGKSWKPKFDKPEVVEIIKEEEAERLNEELLKSKERIKEEAESKEATEETKEDSSIEEVKAEESKKEEKPSKKSTKKASKEEKVEEPKSEEAPAEDPKTEETNASEEAMAEEKPSEDGSKED
ncbi:MAG: phosphodiesterase [Bacilli bacterium]|nr:phosphodiesterase [Bacilli bacterium]